MTAMTIERPRMKIYPKVFYALFAIVFLMTGGRAIVGFAMSRMNPDNRTAEQEAHDYLKYRKYAGAPEPTDTNVPPPARNAECVLGTMGIIDRKPDEPKVTGRPGIDAQAQKDYERALKFQEENSNNRRQGFIMDPTKTGRTPEEMKQKATKYVYYGNVFNYNRESRFAEAVSTIKQLRANDRTKKFLTWFDMDEESFLKEHLECPQAFNGACMKDFAGRDCLLLAPLARMVTEVNKTFYRDEGEELKPIVCYRSNLHQAVAFASTHQCNLDQEAAGLMRPGNSHHGMGLAMDLANQEKAEPYLAEIGVACGFVPGDGGHCSFGENSMNNNLFRTIRVHGLHQLKKGWGKLKRGYKLWKQTH